jgi:hypothetical protein
MSLLETDRSVFAKRNLGSGFLFHKLFHRMIVWALWLCKPKVLRDLPGGF